MKAKKRQNKTKNKKHGGKTVATKRTVTLKRVSMIEDSQQMIGYKRRRS